MEILIRSLAVELLPLLDKLVVTKRAEPSIAAAVLKFNVAAAGEIQSVNRQCSLTQAAAVINSVGRQVSHVHRGNCSGPVDRSVSESHRHRICSRAVLYELGAGPVDGDAARRVDRANAAQRQRTCIDRRAARVVTYAVNAERAAPALIRPNPAAD